MLLYSLKLSHYFVDNEHGFAFSRWESSSLLIVNESIIRIGYLTDGASDMNDF
jgi:hypothetical protein